MSARLTRYCRFERSELSRRHVDSPLSRRDDAMATLSNGPSLARVVVADARHLEALMSVMRAGFDPHYGEAWSLSQLAGTLALDGSFARQALDADDAIQGFTLSRVVAGEAELLLIAVDPSLRRRGIGRLLVDQVAADARRHGATTMFLEVRENNAAARQLYHALGFIDVGRRANYYMGSSGERFAAITMRQMLQD
jgi:[ribosomal protein S18]-alanine N-acetyltransferase